MAQGNVVWILGAGFSKPLGGPLLADLFAPNALQEMEMQFPEEMYRDHSLAGTKERAALEAAVWLYNFGRKFKDGRPPGVDLSQTLLGERLWDDAEEFMDVLGIAAHGAEAYQRARAQQAARIGRPLQRFLQDPEVQRRLGDKFVGSLLVEVPTFIRVVARSSSSRCASR